MGSNREQDDDKPQDVNVQQIGTVPQIPASPTGLGTNFTHVKTSKTVKDDSEQVRDR